MLNALLRHHVSKIIGSSFYIWQNPPLPSQWAMASSFTRILDHTQRCITVGRTSLDEWSARRMTTRNPHNRQTSFYHGGIEPTISVGERPQTYALDRGSHWLFHLTATDPTDYSTSLPWIPLIIPPYRHGSHWLFHLTATDPTDYLTLLPRIPLIIFHLTATDPTDYSSSLPRIPLIIPPHCHGSHWLFNLNATDPTDYSTSFCYVCLSVSVSIRTKQLESYQKYLCGRRYWCILV